MIDDDDQTDRPRDVASTSSSRPTWGNPGRPQDGGANGASPFHKPRVKLVDTGSDLTPAGASFHPPTPSPLPERGAGLLLVLSFASAVTTVTFAVMIANKL